MLLSEYRCSVVYARFLQANGAGADDIEKSLASVRELRRAVFDCISRTRATAAGHDFMRLYYLGGLPFADALKASGISERQGLRIKKKVSGLEELQ